MKTQLIRSEHLLNNHDVSVADSLEDVFMSSAVKRVKMTECDFLSQVDSRVPKEPRQEFSAAKGGFLGQQGEIQEEIF